MALLDKATDFRRSATKTMSERWQTFSMPGAFRRAKEAMTGPAKMPHDPLEDQRAELVELDALISILGTCASTLSTSVDMLAAAPKPLFDPLSRFYSQGMPGSAAIQRLCLQMDGFASHVKEHEAEMEALQNKLRGLSERNRTVHQSFSSRDAAWTSQDHYTKKLEKLRDQIAKSGSSSGLVEKLNRNEEKKRHSQQEFATRTSETGRQVNEALSNRWQEVGEVVAEMCQYYTVVFQAAGTLRQELQQVCAELTKPSTTQALARMGREIASQAQETANTFVDSLRARCSKWNEGEGTGSGPLALTHQYRSSRSSSQEAFSSEGGEIIEGRPVASGYSNGASWPAAQGWPVPSSTWPNEAMGAQQSQPRSPWDTKDRREVRSPWG
ncbi:unnamed protein product [Symbiodinium natans]|uniref:BAR domain-containing protein n=1 Tax=Symbiodinium natans TaxID=878477 RepID=A0A812JWC5_9DINO|nr:unnamed protein product [Symbiodinium natans]